MSENPFDGEQLILWRTVALLSTTLLVYTLYVLLFTRGVSP